MKIDAFIRFKPGDYPDLGGKDKEKFLSTLNQNLEDIVKALQGRLSPDENSNYQTITAEVEADKSYEFEIKDIQGSAISARPFIDGYSYTHVISFPRAGILTASFSGFSPALTGKVAVKIEVRGE